jgi:hypothetical protein
MQTYFDVDLPVESEVSTTAPISAADISVVVQNASGNPDGGNLMADYLQKLGYANVSVDNDWPEPLDRTQVVPQWGNLGAAQELSQKLERSDVTADSTGNLRSDLTIRVGRDWVRQQPPVP